MTIEEAYADDLEAARAKLDAKVRTIGKTEAAGEEDADSRDDAQREFEKDAYEAAEKRDDALADIYQNADQIGEAHPELRLFQDGPYELVGLDVAPQQTVNSIMFFPYYNGYKGENAYGVYDSFYYKSITFEVFKTVTYVEAKKAWQAAGEMYFGPLFRRSGREVDIPVIVRSEVMVDRGLWVDGKPPQVDPAARRRLADQISKYKAYFASQSGGAPVIEPRTAFSSAPSFSTRRPAAPRDPGLPRPSEPARPKANGPGEPAPVASPMAAPQAPAKKKKRRH